MVDTFWNNYWQSLESYYTEKYDLSETACASQGEADPKSSDADVKTSDVKKVSHDTNCNSKSKDKDVKDKKSISEKKALTKKDFSGRVAEAGLKFKQFITDMYISNSNEKSSITFGQSKSGTDEFIIQKYTNFSRKPEKAIKKLGLQMN